LQANEPMKMLASPLGINGRVSYQNVYMVLYFS
jgi:hypothetical protein